MKTSGRSLLAFVLILQCSRMLAAQSLADIARESRARQNAGGARVVVAGPSVGPGAVAQGQEAEYRSTIQDLVRRSAFADLDAAADSARVSKERFAGGVWKLFVFYEGVSSPVGGDRAGATDWSRHIGILEDWVKASPASVTARVALAETYRNLGWKARGGGFSNSVSENNRQQFEQQDEKARLTLMGASLPAKCPHWYFVMLEIARDQGWNSQQARGMFDSAIAFEPGYYHYYREYAANLLPKWNGAPGEAEAFAEESYRRIGGGQGAFVYFEIATVVYCLCFDSQVKPAMSWPKIQEGFAEMEERYGAVPTLKLNRFVALAYLYKDREVAASILNRLNTQWETTLWRNFDAFNFVRTWAGLPKL
jgi:hypothetical protein